LRELTHDVHYENHRRENLSKTGLNRYHAKNGHNKTNMTVRSAKIEAQIQARQKAKVANGGAGDEATGQEDGAEPTRK